MKCIGKHLARRPGPGSGTLWHIYRSVTHTGTLSVRHSPKKVSKPLRVGRKSGVNMPTCHFPTRWVEYPTSFSLSPSVGISSGRPIGLSPCTIPWTFPKWVWNKEMLSFRLLLYRVWLKRTGNLKQWMGNTCSPHWLTDRAESDRTTWRSAIQSVTA